MLSRNVTKWLKATLVVLLVFAMMIPFSSSLASKTNTSPVYADDAVKCVNLDMSAEKTSGGGWLSTKDKFDLSDGTSELVLEFTWTGDTIVHGGGHSGIWASCFDFSGNDYAVAMNNNYRGFFGWPTTASGYTFTTPGSSVRVILTKEKVFFARKDNPTPYVHTIRNTGDSYRYERAITLAENLPNNGTDLDMSNVTLGLFCTNSASQKVKYNMDNFRIYYNGEAQELAWRIPAENADIMSITPTELPASDLTRAISANTTRHGYITTNEWVDLTKENSSVVMYGDSTAIGGYGQWLDVLKFFAGFTVSHRGYVKDDPNSSNVHLFKATDAPGSALDGMIGHTADSPLGTALVVGGSFKATLTCKKLELVTYNANGEITNTKIVDLSSKTWDWSKVRFGWQFLNSGTEFKLENVSIAINGKTALLEWSNLPIGDTTSTFINTKGGAQKISAVSPGTVLNVATTAVKYGYTEAFAAEDLNIGGAQLRLTNPNAGGNGIRFVVEYDKAILDAALANVGNGIVKDVTYGAVLVPYDYVTGGVEMTLESLEENQVFHYHASNFDFHASSNESTYVHYFSLVNLKDYNYDRDFACRAYVTISYVDGRVETIYSDFDASADVKSMAGVAQEAISDRSVEQTEEYEFFIEADGNYSRFTEEELTFLKTFLGE